MERTAVQRLAQLLRGLVLAVLALNILCMLLVPGIVAYVADGGPSMLARALLAELEMWTGGGDGRHFPMAWVFVSAWSAVWTRLETALLTLFYWLAVFAPPPSCGRPKRCWTPFWRENRSSGQTLGP